MLPSLRPKAYSTDYVLSSFHLLSFPCEKSFVPAKFEVNGKNVGKKGVGLRRLCVFGKDRLHYKVYALPAIDD